MTTAAAETKKCKDCINLVYQNYPTKRVFCNITKEDMKASDKACKTFFKKV